MNESLDLRNRINKMRSINNLETNEDEFSKHIKIDPKKTDQKETAPEAQADFFSHDSSLVFTL